MLQTPLTALPLAVVPEDGKVPFATGGIAEFVQIEAEQEPKVVQLPLLQFAEIVPL